MKKKCLNTKKEHEKYFTSFDIFISLADKSEYDEGLQGFKYLASQPYFHMKYLESIFFFKIWSIYNETKDNIQTNASSNKL
jgi:hypothetical protein